MFRLINLSKANQRKFFTFMICSICVLIYILWLASGLLLQTNNAIIQLNTKNVKSDDTKLAIEYINSEDIIFLEDGSKVTEEVKGYIRTEKGSGQYYTSKGYMTAEITNSEAWDLGKNFLLSEVLVTIILLCLTFWKKEKGVLQYLLLITFILMSMLSDIVWSSYFKITLHSDFLIWIIVYTRLMLYFILWLILRLKEVKRRKKLNK